VVVEIEIVEYDFSFCIEAGPIGFGEVVQKVVVEVEFLAGARGVDVGMVVVT